MNISATPSRTNSRWSQACLLLCAICVLPFGVAHGQDHDAVGRRLREAVSKGELTAEQAGAMMGVLKKNDAGPNRREENPRRAGRDWWERISERIESAVDRGDLTREEADAKYREFRERLGRERGR